MKRHFITTSIGVLILSSLSVSLVGCAAQDNLDSHPAPGYATQVDMPVADEPDDSWFVGEIAEEEAWFSTDEVVAAAAADNETGGGIIPIAGTTVANMSDKIIYNMFADIETKNFDESINTVNDMLERYGAFIENSSISGVNYAAIQRGWNVTRNAWFSLRVPVQNLNAFQSNLDSIGNVTHLSKDATNITSQFVDTETRRNSLLIQEERLLDMLARAEDVPDLIAIEERLGEVRRQVESFTTTLNTWQSQVDFSTLNLSINEVERFTEQPEVGFWERAGDGFVDTIRNIGGFFTAVVLWIIVYAPVLVIIAIIAVAVTIVVKRKIKKHKENKEVTL